MKYGEIIVEKKEYELLKQIISMAHYYRDKSYRASIEKLNKELQIAKIMSAATIPDDIIRFNSIVTIDTPGNVKRTYQVVVPEKSDLKENKISILAPMGLALFGYAKDDEIEWQFPLGANTIKILDVLQPVPSTKVEKL